MTKHPKAVFLDLDGTLYFKGSLIPGANSAIIELRKCGLQLRFLTNTDSKADSQILKKLHSFGLDVLIEEIFTPVTALKQFMKNAPGKHWNLLLSDELLADLQYEPINDNASADYVVIGDISDNLDYNRLNNAFQAIMAGAEIIALQKGRYFIQSNGYNLDTGAFVALFEYATSKMARVLGKPSPDFFNLALGTLGYCPEDIIIVGDDVSTDILGAEQIGAISILVKTGKYTDEALSESVHKPDYICTSVRDIIPILKELQ